MPRRSPSFSGLALIVVFSIGCGGDDEPPGTSSADAASDAARDGSRPMPEAGFRDVAPPDPPPPLDADLPDMFVPAPPPPPGAVALLEIHALDIWGQALPRDETSLAVSFGFAPVEAAGWHVAQVPLFDAGSYEIELSATEHETLVTSVYFDGSADLAGAVARPGPEAEGHGVALRHEMRTIDGRALPVHVLYLGLRHRWFAPGGRPARRGNFVSLLMDGEEAWAAADADLRFASSQVLLSTWWWESNFELVRDPFTHATLTSSERHANTILGILESSFAETRILVGQFWGQDSILSWLSKDAALRAYAETPDDGFEMMGMANETEGSFFFEVDPVYFVDRVRDIDPFAAGATFDDEPAIASRVPPHAVDLSMWPIGVSVQVASYHQKFLVVDGSVAYVGGMNLRRVDWDTSDHLVFEPRRMLFDRTVDERDAVAAHEELPDTGPRKDYQIRIEGPAAQDVADVFHERWEEQRSRGVDYSENATPFTVDRAIGAIPGGVQVQVTATLPDPFWEHDIAETWFAAVENANRYIFIEDQYFRIPMLTEAIAARMAAVPDLRLVVITKPISTNDPGCAWTHRTDTDLASRFPDRYVTLQLRAFDTQVTFGFDETDAIFQDMDVHSKLLIVDDVFLSVGSANKNNRGIVYEGELNVAVV
ncbi:MAG: hypothetical protein IT379_31210, partial [Deltaproteobacteria bacterium]|nr:hypothetical protein [Deltaproteobacteria bacterium]